MTKKVTVIDYGVGNLLSVERAFEHFGAEVLLTSDPKHVLDAELLVLPGVGAFHNGMAELSRLNLVDVISEFATKERPFLGICLGMQMMLSMSEEFGETKGLNLIPGKVIKIPDTDASGNKHKIPHIGWSALRKPSADTNWDQTILQSTNEGEMTYFVHSFTAMPENESHRLADCEYDGRKISAAIRRDNLYGCQFHPEKSGEAGLKMIEAFLKF
ncbi:MAG: imidazole glycerol phosphate synthase subunit HisH [Deltaproteobacteria bacterium]|nr:imidazole glycerol phosphate synthase subunit HisH [Deltaproteobacteria bacterium]